MRNEKQNLNKKEDCSHISSSDVRGDSNKAPNTSGSLSNILRYSLSKKTLALTTFLLAGITGFIALEADTKQEVTADKAPLLTSSDDLAKQIAAEDNPQIKQLLKQDLLQREKIKGLQQNLLEVSQKLYDTKADLLFKGDSSDSNTAQEILDETTKQTELIKRLKAKVKFQRMKILL